MGAVRSSRMRGQAMVEFAAAATVLLLVFTGIMDLSFLFASHVATTNSARASARYAAANPTAWTNAANPASNTIEGQLKLLATPAVIVNDDTHIQITYTVPGAGAGTLCGKYSAASNTFVPTSGTDFTQATCVVPGHLVTVKATYSYSFMTPFLAQPFGSVTVSSTASELEET